MTYRIVRQNGDSIAVPQLVFHQLPNADEASVRVALYVLATGSTDPRDIAPALHLKSPRAAESALLWWAGAGLLEVVHPEDEPAAAPVEKPLPTIAQINEASVRDPMIAVLTTETQAALGVSLGHSALQQLVALYLNEDYPIDVILPCAAHVAGCGRHSVAALRQELRRWRADGVETGEQAEAYLERLARRQQSQKTVAEMLGLSPEHLTLTERTRIAQWSEEFGYGEDMVREALLHAGEKREVRYLHGILKAWHAKGWRTVQDVRGSGALTGSNVRADRPAPSGRDIFQRAPGRVRRLKREE